MKTKSFQMKLTEEMDAEAMKNAEIISFTQTKKS